MRGFSLLELTLVLALLGTAMSFLAWPSPRMNEAADDAFVSGCVVSVYSVQRTHQVQLLFSESKEWPCDNIAD